jgi:hypothetical protein
MTENHDFGYSFPFFSSLLKKEGRRKGEWIAKIGIKNHAFLIDQIPEFSWFSKSNSQAPFYPSSMLKNSAKLTIFYTFSLWPPIVIKFRWNQTMKAKYKAFF